MTSSNDRLCRMPDGRLFAYTECGDPKGKPVFYKTIKMQSKSDSFRAAHNIGLESFGPGDREAPIWERIQAIRQP